MQTQTMNGREFVKIGWEKGRKKVMMNIAYIDKEDVLNGPGIRVSPWTQGCNFKCKNCHNEHLQDFNGGTEFDTEKLANQLIEFINQPHIEGLSVLGGEPLQQDPFELYALLKKIKKETQKSIWLWSGYKESEIGGYYIPGLGGVDVLIDVCFMEDKTDSFIFCNGFSIEGIIYL